MNKPPISCVCMTYGRTWLLAEAIESYLRQDYAGTSELLIVNDFEGLTLLLTTSGCKPNQSIRVVNLPHRMTSLNDKFDFGVKLAVHELVCMWDDDDISLPHRLSQSAQAWHDMGQPGYLSHSHHYNLDAGKRPTIIPRGIHGADMFTRTAYLALGGSSGEGHNDENFVAKAKEDGIFDVHDNGQAPAYVYRWGGITAHHSCYARDVATCMRKFHDDVIQDRRFVKGKVKVVPAWAQDYAEVCGTGRKRQGVKK